MARSASTRSPAVVTVTALRKTRFSRRSAVHRAARSTTAARRAEERVCQSRFLRCVAAEPGAERRVAEVRPRRRHRCSMEGFFAALPGGDETAGVRKNPGYAGGAIASVFFLCRLLLRRRSALPSFLVTAPPGRPRCRSPGVTARRNVRKYVARCRRPIANCSNCRCGLRERA